MVPQPVEIRPVSVSPRLVARAFDQDVSALDSRLEKFIKSGDSLTTASLRKAARRMRASYSVLPRKVRLDWPIRRYLAATRKVSRAAGKVRDLDMIAAWTMQISEGKDKRSFLSDLDRRRASNLRAALLKARALTEAKAPSLAPHDLDKFKVGKRVQKVERRLVKRVDKEFEEFISTQEVEVMHALRKDSKRLRHILELSQNGASPALLGRLKSIQDDLGAIRDHDLVIDYLRSKVRLTSTRSLVREEIAKRHARLEDFVTKNRGQGHLIPVAENSRNLR